MYMLLFSQTKGKHNKSGQVMHYIFLKSYESFVWRMGLKKLLIVKKFNLMGEKTAVTFWQ